MSLARWQATIVDDDGNALPSATITVRKESNAALATLFSDRAGSTGVANPRTADANGFVFFYVNGDAYKITAVSGAFTREWRHVAIGTAAELDIEDLNTTIGLVVGPASATNDHVAAFDGATGKIIKDTGVTYPSSSIVGVTDTQTLQNKTIDNTNTIDIAGRSHKASPTSSDKIMIADAADGNANKYSTLAEFGNLLVATLDGHFYGLVTSNNVVTPNTKLDIAAGSCGDSTNVALISMTAGTIDCTTVGANGLSTDVSGGALANSTWYFPFVIMKADGTKSRLASVSPTAPTLPTGYIYFRRVGAFKTNGSAQIIPFTQRANDFDWNTPVRDLNNVTAHTTLTAKTLASVPLGIAVKAHINIGLTSDTNNLHIGVYPTTQADQTPVIAGTPIADAFDPSTTGLQGAGKKDVWANTSAQVNVKCSRTTGAYDVSTWGWTDYL